MLRIKREIFRKNPTIREIAQKAGLATETLNRIVNGKQTPGYGTGQSAERIAIALGWPPERAAELFEEAEEVQ